MNAYPDQDFSALLDDLIARSAQAGEHAPSIAVDILGVMDAEPERAAGSGEAMAAYVRSAEWEQVELEAFEVLDKIVVVEPPSIEPGDIARELGLSAAPATARELDRVRREFAFANHPDRVDASLRDRAMVRMQIANRLIDDAKSRAPGTFRA